MELRAGGGFCRRETLCGAGQASACESRTASARASCSGCGRSVHPRVKKVGLEYSKLRPPFLKQPFPAPHNTPHCPLQHGMMQHRPPARLPRAPPGFLPPPLLLSFCAALLCSLGWGEPARSRLSVAVSEWPCAPTYGSSAYFRRRHLFDGGNAGIVIKASRLWVF